LQLILQRSNRKEPDLLAAIFRRAILLHQRHETEGYLGAQRKILRRFSITIVNVYACAAASNGRETLYLLVDDDSTVREVYEVGDASFSNNELMWIQGRLDRGSLQSLLEDEAVWNAYGRMLPKVANFPLARSNHNNRGKMSVISGKRYEPESGASPNYWWVNQGATYQQEREWEAVRTMLDGSTSVEEDYVEPSFDQVLSAVLEQGTKVSERSLRRYHLGLKSRGFVILSGVSGGGKT
jgi:hypothetical protein